MRDLTIRWSRLFSRPTKRALKQPEYVDIVATVTRLNERDYLYQVVAIDDCHEFFACEIKRSLTGYDEVELQKMVDTIAADNGLTPVV